MASFTDSISKFNPYIAQLPVETMAKVGMYKQEKYDQGVQKIQGFVDNIAGMDVAGDANKAALQSKLNELGGKLKTVAAGDFSNNQLVNSVGGMATQIVKDPIVQSALSETAKYRKDLARIEKDVSDGKSARNNIDDYMIGANAWLDGEAGAPLKARYATYRDVNKTAIDAIKTLHPGLASMDIPFQMKDGKLDVKSIADAMVRNKIEGVTEDRIEGAVRAALTPDDYNQLAIDGRAQFRGYTPEKLIEVIGKNLKTDRDVAIAEIAFLNSQKVSYIKDPIKTKEIDDRIARQELLIGKDGKPGKLDEDATADIADVNADPDQVKYSIYKQGFFKQFGDAFKWQSEERQYVTNPLKTVEQWNTDFTFKEKTQAEQVRQFGITSGQAERKLVIEEQKAKDEHAAFAGDVGVPVEIGNKTTHTLESPKMLNDHILNVTNSILQSKTDLLDKGYSEDQVNNMISDYEKNGNKSNISASDIGTIQDIIKQKAYFNQLDKFKSNTLREAQAEVAKDPEMKAKMDASRAFVNNNFTTSQVATVRTYDGLPMKIDGKSVINALKSGDAKLSVDTAPGGYLRFSYNLNGRQITASIPKRSGGAQPEGAAQLRPILEKANEYFNKYGKIDNEIATKVDGLYRNKLAPRVTALVPTMTAVGFGKDKTLPSQIANNLSTLITASDLKDIAADDAYDSDKASAMLTAEGLKDTRVFIRQDGDNVMVQMKSEKNPKDIQNLKLTVDNAIRTFGPNYIRTNTQEAIKLKLGRGSTNVNNNPKESEMQVQYGDFPNISHYQMGADLVEDTKLRGQFVPKVHVLLKDGGYQTFELSGKNKSQRLGYEQGKSNLSKLNDQELIKLLKESYPKYDFSNLYYHD